MGIKKKLLKGAGYVAAPKLAFTLQHPRKAAVAKAAGWAMSRVGVRRKSTSMGSTAAKGLGAAALALPVGLWLGRRMMSERQPQAM